MSVPALFLVLLAVGMSQAMVSTRLQFLSSLSSDKSWWWSHDKSSGSSDEAIKSWDEESWKSKKSSAGTPKPCCLPPQWEAKISGSVTYQKHWFFRPETVYEFVDFHFDGVNKRLAATSKVYFNGGETTRTFKVIELYKEKKLYIIDPEGNCKTKTIDGDFYPLCIPPTATFLTSYTMGLGDELIEGNAWMTEYRDFKIVLDVTPKQCIPLMETFFQKPQGWMTTHYTGILGYLDISAGIKTPAVFTPPKDCTSEDGKSWDDWEGVTRYLHEKMKMKSKW